MKDHHALRYFFEPDGVAVIGASSNPEKGGSHIIRNMLRWFPGEVYPVNPRGEEIFGRPAYRSVLDLPRSIDLAILLIPAPSIPNVLHQCGKKGVKAVLIESGGFAEAGAEGKRLSAEIVAIAGQHGMRIWGPNCTGLIDSRSGVVTPFAYVDAIQKGPVSFVGQSGMLSGVLTMYIAATNMFGVAKTCAIGNKADLNECDFLEYLGEDPDTKIISMYLESIVDGRRFMDAAARISREKPLLVVKSGRTDQGARASQSHTASLAVDDRIVGAAFKQSGVIRLDDLMEMLDVTKAFSMQPFQNAGPRVAVVTTSGGSGVMASDELARRGLLIPRLSERATARLRQVFPSWFEPDNPIDIWSTAEQIGINRALQHSLTAALEDDGIDMVLITMLIGPRISDFDFDGLADIVHRYGKPVVTFSVGVPETFEEWRKGVEERDLPCLGRISTAAAALAAMRDFVAHRSAPMAHSAKSQSSPLGNVVQDTLARARHERRRALNEHEAKLVLGDYGVPATAESLVTSEEEAVAAASRLGFPVALKIASAEITHKSEAGGVRLGLTSETAVREAYRAITRAVAERAPEACVDGVLVQEMVDHGAEVIVGMTRDPQFGPVIMFGLGGVFVEVLEDVAFRVAPLTETDADALIKEVKGYRLLEGARGNPPADVAAIRNALVAVSRLAIDYPAIAQIDVNPLVVFPDGLGAKAADALITLEKVD